MILETKIVIPEKCSVPMKSNEMLDDLLYRKINT